MESSPKKILLIYNNYSTFIERDYEILSESNVVHRYHFKSSKKFFILSAAFLKQFFFFFFKGWGYDVFFIWFADYHSFLPVFFAKLLKKQSYIVSGGFDATAIPELKYGLFNKNNLRSFMGRESYIWCNNIFPVHKSLITTKNTYAFPYEFKAGIITYCKVPENKFMTIPTGYDVKFWNNIQGVKRDNSIVSVASVTNLFRWKLKGGDMLMQVAKELPQYNFYFYGISDNFMNQLRKMTVPENFHLKGFISNESLPEIYSKHKVYAQFSISEGLPNSLCEAMLCGCIPVGSNVNGIPEAIGTDGFILDNRDINQAKVLIDKAITIKGKLNPRNRIINLYDIEHRKTKLNAALNMSKQGKD